MPGFWVFICDCGHHEHADTQTQLEAASIQHWTHHARRDPTLWNDGRLIDTLANLAETRRLPVLHMTTRPHPALQVDGFPLGTGPCRKCLEKTPQATIETFQ